jgi:hypothetical protein
LSSICILEKKKFEKLSKSFIDKELMNSNVTLFSKREAYNELKGSGFNAKCHRKETFDFVIEVIKVD